MDTQIEKINENDFKVIDFTPVENIYNIDVLEAEIASLENNIIEYNKLIALQEAQIVEKKALVDSVKAMPTPVIEAPME